VTAAVPTIALPGHDNAPLPFTTSTWSKGIFNGGQIESYPVVANPLFTPRAFSG